VRISTALKIDAFYVSPATFGSCCREIVRKSRILFWLSPGVGNPLRWFNAPGLAQLNLAAEICLASAVAMYIVSQGDKKLKRD
jgi:hypothetical protein